jgi:ubiquinone/menaquinone biosynthesis C-methylase UbiE
VNEASWAPHHDTTRRSYDAVAARYAETFGSELDHKPLDRALLDVVLEEVGSGAVVADLGCGPGHVAAWLAERGARSVGIDLSEVMVDTGRREFPRVEFRQGDLLALPAADDEFDAAVCFYSIIHLRPEERDAAFAEMRRVLRPGAPLLVAFHVGTEVRHRDEWWGHEVELDFRFFEMDDVIEAVEGAGFGVAARVQRVHYPDEVDTTRGYLLAR